MYSVTNAKRRQVRRCRRRRTSAWQAAVGRAVRQPILQVVDEWGYSASSGNTITRRQDMRVKEICRPPEGITAVAGPTNRVQAQTMVWRERGGEQPEGAQARQARYDGEAKRREGAAAGWRSCALICPLSTWRVAALERQGKREVRPPTTRCCVTGASVLSTARDKKVCRGNRSAGTMCCAAGAGNVQAQPDATVTSCNHAVPCWQEL